MNNKGQSLVLFILLIPLVLLILFMIYDIANMVQLKIELDNINYLAVDYGIDKMNDDDIYVKLNKLIIKNKPDIDSIAINIAEDKLNIVLEDKLDKMFISKFFSVKSSYTGYIEDDKKKIMKG